MANVLNKSCRENQNNAFYIQQFFFPKIVPYNVQISGGATEAADENMAARCMLDK
jgi:hypothetical protein